ncbi:MAG TPA: AAA family ATPase [Gemmatimonadaceae bacterium]|jgi:DNA-binding SARP family transcriptional activator
MAQDEAVQLVVRGLGRAEVTLGTLVLVPEHGMLFPLALLLAQRCGERIARAELIELLWPGSDDAAGRHSLRQALYRLRKAGLNLDDRTDDVRLERDVVDSDLTAVLRHDWPFCAEPADIERVASVLPGFVPADGSRLAEWLDQLRARLAAQYRQATLHRIALARREGRWREVEHWALMCLQGDSLNEEATLARAEALAMVGAKNAALEVLDTYLREIGDRARVIGLPARMLRRRISELTDTTGRRVTATSAPFIGRHDLLARAQDILALARGGEATVQWFVGPPGIGKSRLLREMSRAARMAGWCVVAGGARPSYEDRPFALLTELLPHLLEAPGALGADPDALTLMRQMGRADTGEEPLEPEEARGRQYAVYLSWVELMDAVLGEAPLAIFVDDAQWADPITLLMMARLLESRPHVKLAVILSARRVPTRDDGAAQRLLGAAQERIAPLTDEEMREFTRSVGTVSESEFDEVTQRLGAVSGGNPLFLGHLVHQHTTHRESPTMPADLATLIDEQVRTLSRDALRLLQACALLGQHATLPRVERVLGVEAPWLVTPFGELDDMLALPSEPGQPLAPHDLWTERVRHGMTAGVFRSLAVSAARVLEADAQSDGGIEIYWDAARLYQESGEKQLAYATMMRCAEYLMRTGAASDASNAYEAAVEYASSPAATHAALQGRMLAQQTEEVWADVLDTIARTRSLDLPWTPDQIGSLDLARLNAEWWLGTDEATMVSQLRHLATDEQLSASIRLASAVLGMAASDNGLDADGISWFFELMREIGAQTNLDQIAFLKGRVIYETAIGELHQAEEAGRRLLRAARESQDDAEVINALKFAHYPARRMGSLNVALDRLAQAAKIADRHKRPHARATIADLMAGVHLDYGDYEEAIRLTHDVTDHPKVLGGAFRQQSALDTRALAYCLLGRFDEARSLVSRPAEIIARGRRRAQYMSMAAALLVASHDQDTAVILECLSAIDAVRDKLFRHSGPDVIAIAYADGITRVHGSEAAVAFVQWYVRHARRDTLPLPGALAALLGLSASGTPSTDVAT